MTMSDTPSEQKPAAEWVGSFGGFPVWVDPNLAPGWVQFRDKDGRIIGMISDVGQVRVARSRAP